MASPPPVEDDLTFAPQELGRSELVRMAERQAHARHAPSTFAQPAAPATTAAAPGGPAVEELPWTVRNAPAPRSIHGWGTRHTELMVQAAEATLRKLRDEAVQVTWKASWLAVTSADDRLARRREL